MDAIFMNSENSKPSDPHRLLLNLSDKINFKRSDEYIALSNFNIYLIWKNVKNHMKIISLEYQPQRGMKSLNYLIYIINIKIYIEKYMRQLLIILQ